LGLQLLKQNKFPIINRDESGEILKK